MVQDVASSKYYLSDEELHEKMMKDVDKIKYISAKRIDFDELITNCQDFENEEDFLAYVTKQVEDEGFTSYEAKKRLYFVVDDIEGKEYYLRGRSELRPPNLHNSSNMMYYPYCPTVKLKLKEIKLNLKVNASIGDIND